MNLHDIFASIRKTNELNEARRSAPSADLYFHGTTSLFLPSIQKNGLVPEPKQKVYGPGHGLESFPGVYLAGDYSGAYDAAEHAVYRFGGEPVVIGVMANSAKAHADEDRVWDFFNNYFGEEGESYDLKRFFNIDRKQFFRNWGHSEFQKSVFEKIYADFQSWFGRVDQSLFFNVLDATIQTFRKYPDSPVGMGTISEMNPRYRGWMHQLIDSIPGSNDYTGMTGTDTIRIKDPIGFRGIPRIVWIIQGERPIYGKPPKEFLQGGHFEESVMMVEKMSSGGLLQMIQRDMATVLKNTLEEVYRDLVIKAKWDDGNVREFANNKARWHDEDIREFVTNQDTDKLFPSTGFSPIFSFRNKLGDAWSESVQAYLQKQYGDQIKLADEATVPISTVRVHLGNQDLSGSTAYWGAYHSMSRSSSGDFGPRLYIYMNTDQLVKSIVRAWYEYLDSQSTSLSSLQFHPDPINTLMHEVQHLEQHIRSAKHPSRDRRLAVRGTKTKDTKQGLTQKYLMLRNEVDAHAAGAAAEMITKKFSDPHYSWYTHHNDGNIPDDVWNEGINMILQDIAGGYIPREEADKYLYVYDKESGLTQDQFDDLRRRFIRQLARRVSEYRRDTK